MNDNAKKVVEALRSGEYTQGKGRLCTNRPQGPCFCVLGLICEVYRKVTGFTGWVESPHDLGLRFRGETGRLPRIVQAWVGFRSPNGDFINSDGHWTSLTALNDHMAGCSFQEFADLIESEPERLFA